MEELVDQEDINLAQQEVEDCIEALLAVTADAQRCARELKAAQRYLKDLKINEPKFSF